MPIAWVAGSSWVAGGFCLWYCILWPGMNGDGQAARNNGKKKKEPFFLRPHGLFHNT